MDALDEKIALLPPDARQEAYDFVEFLLARYVAAAEAEQSYWKSIAGKGLEKTWANKEDDVYNELFKR